MAFVTIPPGSTTNPVVTLQATNFTQAFQTWVDATPESGPSWRTNFIWQYLTSGSITNVIVPVPTNSPTRVTVWGDYSFRYNEH